jgi:drug/metabolite transporter (DMT)-like permease
MLGMLLSLVAAAFFGTATTIQKYCMHRMKSFSLRRLMRKRLWLVSVLLGVFGILGYEMALSYETISIVQPMMSLSILIPVVAGWMLFGEKIGAKWLHIALIIAGVVLISL